MTENLLQFIWQHRLYSNSEALQTTDGSSLIVQHPGTLNTHAGPDFSEAKIKIEQTLWVGNVELHIKSSDWNKHAHQKNENYEKLILHVVYENDDEIETKNNTLFPTLELKKYIDTSLLKKYEYLMEHAGFIPCEKNILHVKSIFVQLQMERMLAERLEEKTSHIIELLKKYNNNWQEVFYVQLAMGFGLHINQYAFEQLALNTPISLLAKHKNNPLQIEALLFGQAGFLNDYFDEVYPTLLQTEYQYVKKLHSLENIEKKHWKFLRLRPANFPTIRIAQFAQLILDSTHLFSKILHAKSIKEIEQLFKINVSDYWLTHYTFNEKSLERKKSLGKSFVQTLIINSIVPTLFIYGKLQAKDEYCKRAILFLEQLPAESNSIITQWQALNIEIKNAAHTQAFIQLYKRYCTEKRCLECSIGYSILRKNEQDFIH